MPTAVTRDAGKIDAEYNLDKWARVHALIRDARRLHGDDLSRCFWHVMREFRGRPGLESAEAVFRGRAHELPRTAIWEAYHGSVAEVIHDAMGSDTDVVMELGSGWGLYLFLLWLRGAPRDARYYAMEYTENGRLGTEELAATEANMNVRALPFDFYDADYGQVERGRHAVVFSCTAIEQIPHLPASAISGLLDVADDVTGVHLEPIGWQFRAQVGEGDRHGTSRAYAERHDYSRDLWATLETLQRDGVIRIEVATPDEIGAGLTNVLSVIRWRKVSG